MSNQTMQNKNVTPPKKEGEKNMGYKKFYVGRNYSTKSTIFANVLKLKPRKGPSGLELWDIVCDNGCTYSLPVADAKEKLVK